MDAGKDAGEDGQGALALALLRSLLLQLVHFTATTCFYFPTVQRQVRPLKRYECEYR